jgi:hypothetical protein
MLKWMWNQEWGWISMAQDKYQWWTVAKMLMNLWVSWKAVSFMTSWLIASANSVLCVCVCVWVWSYCGVKLFFLLIYTFSFTFISGICKGALFCLASHITVHWEHFNMTVCSMVLTTNVLVLVQCICINTKFLLAKLCSVLEIFSLDPQAHVIADKHVVYCMLRDKQADRQWIMTVFTYNNVPI